MGVNDKALLKKNPFVFNWTEQFIACVGENGGTTDDDILAGFKGAALLIIDDIKNGNGTEDELIYPLVYAVRHSVELALKISINLIKDIYELKGCKFIIEPKKLHEHNIRELSDSIKLLYSVDRRVPELFNIAMEYVKDYYFDEKSDAFRYECDLEGQEILKKVHISEISIGILEEKFSRMIELLENAIYSLYKMREEYSVGTWTKTMSRHDIEQVSKDLIPRSIWNEDRFDDNKNDIKKKYGIGSKELTEVIDLVQANSLFANNIGVSILLGSIRSDELEKYACLVAYATNKNIHKGESCKIGEGLSELLAKSPEEARERENLTAEMSDDALSTIAAFGDMVETNDCYCENFIKHYEHVKIKNKVQREWLIRKVMNCIYAEKVLMGMEWCGQSTYLNILKPRILEIADNNSISLKYE